MIFLLQKPPFLLVSLEAYVVVPSTHKMTIIQSLNTTPLAARLLLSKSHSESPRFPGCPAGPCILTFKNQLSSKPPAKHHWVRFLTHFRTIALPVWILLHPQTRESHPWLLRPWGDFSQDFEGQPWWTGSVCTLCYFRWTFDKTR